MSGLLNKLTHHNSAGANTHSTVSSGTTLNSSVEAPIIQQRTIVDAPIIQETVRNDRIVEIQPVLHREVDKNVVHHIEKHIQEPHAPSMGGVIERNPLVQQNIHTNVVNEIQPVIHRERVVPVTERVEEHLMQRVVEPTVHTHEVVYESAPMNNNLNLNSNSSYSTVNNTAPLAGAPLGTSNTSATHSSKHGLFHRH